MNAHQPARRQRFAVVLALTLNLAACATVQHGPVQRIHVDSEPSEAVVRTEKCGPGSTKEVRTPGVVWVSRRADRCTLTFSAEGYESERVELTRAVAEEFLDNVEWFGVCGDDLVDCDVEWLFLGSFLAGTGFGVDAITGALFEQQPNDVLVTLNPLEEP
jgi:hypothetical protein